MKISKLYMLLLTALLFLVGGCVERKLTIVTQPSDAVVWLNDEEIGTTPVTVNFNWYGDYYIRIEKPGCEILSTHRKLKRPLHDVFPFDFFAQALWPGTIVDAHQWDFELKPFQQASADELIKSAGQMRRRASEDVGKIAVELLTETAD